MTIHNEQIPCCETLHFISEFVKHRFEREYSLLYFFSECSIKYKDEKIKQARFCLGDRGDTNPRLYSMCYDKNNSNIKKYCGPCWAFYHWPSSGVTYFRETVKNIIIESNKTHLIDKVGWYGNIHTPNHEVMEHQTRPLLKKIGEENPELFDIVHATLHHNYISFPELTLKYKYLIDIGGNGYSGRLKYLLFSKRPIFLVDRPYIEYFHDELIPFQHYIPVKRDLSDLLEQVNWARENDEKCLEIANNAFEFAINNFTEEKLLARVYEVYNNLHT
jgi:hypothetical protein